MKEFLLIFAGFALAWVTIFLFILSYIIFCYFNLRLKAKKKVEEYKSESAESDITDEEWKNIQSTWAASAEAPERRSQSFNPFGVN